MKKTFGFVAPLLALGLLALVSPAGMAQSGEAVELQDALASRGAAGTPLDGRHLDHGSAIWETTKNIVLGEAGASLTDRGSFVARVAIPRKGEVYRLKAKANPVPAGETTSWIAIGLGNPSLTPVSTTWVNGLFLLLTTEGKYELNLNPGNGELIRIKGGRAPSYWEQSANTLAMDYDRASQTVSIAINDVPVLEHFALPGESANIDPVFTGFSGYEQKSGLDSLSNFEFSIH